MSMSRLGCYICNIFCGTLAYADDVIILAPSVASMRGMLSICESFANDYNIILNSCKSKLLVFPEVDNKEVSIMFLGGIIEHVVECNHLDNIIGVSSDKRNIEANIWQFNAKLNVLMRELCYVNFEIKYLKTYCMSLFGSPLCGSLTARTFPIFMLHGAKVYGNYCIYRIIRTVYCLM